MLDQVQKGKTCYQEAWHCPQAGLLAIRSLLSELGKVLSLQDPKYPNHKLKIRFKDLLAFFGSKQFGRELAISKHP